MLNIIFWKHDQCYFCSSIFNFISRKFHYSNVCVFFYRIQILEIHILNITFQICLIQDKNPLHGYQKNNIT